MNRITVIGAGNGGVTAAYHFSKLGNDVCLYDQEGFDTQLKAIQSSGGIEALSELSEVELILQGFERIDRVTTKIEEALTYSNMLVMIVPSFAQEVLFDMMLPFLTEEHILFSLPGNYASLALENHKKARGYSDLNLTFVDAMTIPWACRLSDPGRVGIMGIKEFIYAAVHPKSKEKEAIVKINEFFPIEVRLLENVIEAGLENINFGGHPLITTLNMGLLENFKGHFNYYCDCVSPSTDKVSEKMELERIEIGKGFGLNLRPELEMMNALYDTDAKSVYEFNKTSVTHGKIHSAPDSSSSRYITEDVPYLLVPVYEFSKLLGIEVPIVESCIRIASAYNDVDYFKTGRTLDKMGFGNMTKEDILRAVNR
ncbi:MULTISPECIES: NAD/NADP octopine/nopaline dehydrogenase family protein [unclassified Fusibacter]|uniref:NAD/NADP-dependent octopine/nopaline dehydrogenase family protein n=1 Tax=unclassified Fusibacter TaxID=2624464 RepID=UPI001011DE39|nr:MULTISPECIES: NAD/NADP octopine/nopaline dehydrogenase family protein [unclassified Fusibacter]MCK8060755.1 NAD/NADP octopine/nopaline dehydrogenase family protein [Fusibacter sp. A2]NPE23051.1 nopaline dehydrogenase [Fusibacter sp. A1]RXV59723.1 nopaline dehydrogenase [Fusibacter sp. A1]